MKKVFAILIIFQLLFNSMWASAHMSVDEHGGYESVHVHLGDHHHRQAENSNDASNSHEVEGHIHLLLYVSHETADQVTPSLNSLPSHDDSSFLSLLLTPPVPPPNA